MDWMPITSEAELEDVIKRSYEQPIALFKHSTRCGISAMAKRRLESEWDIDKEKLPLYYLDLLKHRDISNRIANDLKIRHESPQILLIRNGECFYDASHSGVSVSSIKSALSGQ